MKDAETASITKTAVVLGATGLVGQALLGLLLADRRYARVRCVVRRPLDREHPKLENDVVDFERLGEASEFSRADHVFVCLGTTIKKAGSRDAFYRVDHDYVVHAARESAGHGVAHFAWVSAMGANPRSAIFYNRVKGQVERDVAALGLTAWSAVRPSLLLGQRGEHRPGEAAAIAVAGALAWAMIGPLRFYKPIPAKNVAASLIALANGGEADANLQVVHGGLGHLLSEGVTS